MVRRIGRIRSVAAVLAVGPILCLGPAAVRADDESPLFKMREVVVSARAADGTLRTTPHSLSIITAADIERSSAVTVAELLAREANVNLQSYSGTDKQATIDIRGMGATSTSNVLVVVDGVRLNESDLSGADLASIPLSQIERIEILRGGGGSLRRRRRGRSDPHPHETQWPARPRRRSIRAVRVLPHPRTASRRKRQFRSLVGAHRRERVPDGRLPSQLGS
ncbi:MAG: TonB-dependent receptor [Betaproteobacteria bacterium]|nr:TonB-dependent receptor [Betaproteobacteria bacterium]